MVNQRTSAGINSPVVKVAIFTHSQSAHGQPITTQAATVVGTHGSPPATRCFTILFQMKRVQIFRGSPSAGKSSNIIKRFKTKTEIELTM